MAWIGWWRERVFRGQSGERRAVQSEVPGVQTGGWPTRGGARRSIRLRTLGLILGLVFGVVLSGCRHARETNPAGGALLYGCAQVRVLEALDYALPRQTSQMGVIITMGLEEARGKRAKHLRATTDRSGCFYLDHVAPGRYRVLEIRLPGRQSSAGRKLTPDLEFPLWERTLEMGFEGLSTSPTSEGELPEAIFDVRDGDTRYLGNFVLSFQKEPYEAPGGCLIRDSLIKGMQGELYFSSEPVGAKLCVEQKPEEARAFLEKRLGHRISADGEG